MQTQTSIHLKKILTKLNQKTEKDTGQKIHHIQLILKYQLEQNKKITPYQPEVKEKANKTKREWKEKNKDKVNKQKRTYAQTFKEKARRNKYDEEHKDGIRELDRKRYDVKWTCPYCNTTGCKK